MSKDKAYILVEFDEENRAMFDIYTTDDSQLLIGLMGIEGYLAKQTGLDCEDIRSLIDEEKKVVEVKPRLAED